MGTIIGGLQGKVSSTVGNLVLYTSGDRQMVRTKTENSSSFSPAQLANQARFKAMQDWVQPLTAFLRVGCRNNNPNMSGSALAIQYMSAHAISGKGEQYQISPEQMKVSLGILPGSPVAGVVLEEQEAVFSWDPTLGIQCHSYDEVLLLAYNVAQQSACYSVKGHFRKDGTARLQLFEAGEYHCYLSFVAEDRSRQSNSQYLGVVVV